MRSKKAIIAQIKKLYREKKPLNISAVKRHSPTLLRDAYAFKKFWGWKQAIDEACLDYGKLNTELKTECTCEICGAQARVLTLHLLRIHEVTPTDYIAEFPQSEIMAEDIRAARSCVRYKTIPHWEPIWTPEYVLDRLWLFYQLDYSLNFKNIVEVDTGLSTSALKYFGDWDSALTAIGVEPNKFRLAQKPKNYDRKGIIRELKRRVAEGLAINTGTLEKEDGSLLNAIRRIFKTTTKAYRAAGIRPQDAYLRQNIVAKDIEAIHKEARAISRLYGKERYQRLKKLLRKRGKEINNSTNLRSWAKLAQSIGLPPEQWKVAAYSRKADVLYDLIKRKKQGKSIQAKDVFYEDRNLHKNALKHFGDFKGLPRNIEAGFKREAQRR